MMTINEIFQRQEINVRAYNVCRRNKIFSISDLNEFYQKNKSFEKLEHCGDKSAKVLIDLCNRYAARYNSHPSESKENSLESLILNLSGSQKKVINNFIGTATNNLPRRSKNIIQRYLEYDLKIENFAQKILLYNQFDLKTLKNAGDKTVSELNAYIQSVENFIVEISEIKEDKDLAFLNNDFLIKYMFPDIEIPHETIKTGFVFSIVDFLLNNNVLYDKRETFIVSNGLKLYRHQEGLSLDEIASQVKLSKVRVRQIRVKSFDVLFNKLALTSNLNHDLLQNYGIDTETHYIEIDTNLVEKINHLNGTNFSKEFITYILSAFLKNSFDLVGNGKDVLEVLGYNMSVKHRWNNIFIVKKEITSEIDFTSLSKDVFKRLSAKIADSYTIDFESYLSLFLINGNHSILDIAFPVVKKILKDEFGVLVDSENNIVFDRNTRKLSHEYAYEALEEIGKIAKVSEITAKIKELHPNFETNVNKVRSSLKRENGFVPIGRKSVFGLKKWEYEKADFKGGTIREITKNYLLFKQRPIHIFELSEYVTKFRPDTYVRSILDNLKADESKDFIFLKNSFIGLSENKDFYDLEKFENLPSQLGIKIISLNQNGMSVDEIILFLKNEYNLDKNDSKSIINNLDHFNNQYQPV